MSLFDFGLLLFTGLCMSGANLLMKRGVSGSDSPILSLRGLLHLAQQPSLIAGALLTGIGAIIWLRILSTQKLSTCYPLFVSLTYLLITIGAFCFFGEKISMQKLVGLGAIVLGMLAVAQG